MRDAAVDGEVGRRGPFGGVLGVPAAGFALPEDSVDYVDLRRRGSSRGRCLVPRAPCAGGPAERRYHPFALPGLLDAFVEIEDDASLVRFAGEYGELGVTVQVGKKVPVAPGSYLPPSPRYSGADMSEQQGRRRLQNPANGEPLDDWWRWIHELRSLRQMHRWAEEGDEEALRACVRWERDPDRVFIGAVSVDGVPDPRGSLRFWDGLLRRGCYETPDHYFARDRSVRYGVERVVRDRKLLESWRHGDPVDPARWYVADRVGEALRGRLRVRIGSGEVVSEPTDLLGALFALLALDLAGIRFAPGEKRCAYPGCPRAFPRSGRQRYCVDHQAAAKQQRDRDSWHANKEVRNPRRRKGDG